MKKSPLFPSRRSFVASAASLLAMPAVLRVENALAADLSGAVGQMLMLGFYGKSAGASSAKALARHVASGAAGGVVFLGHNAKSRSGISSLNEMFLSSGNKPLIAIDHEGGKVQRLNKKLGFTALPTALQIARNSQPRDARRMYANSAKEMKSVGFNFNMAPVVDLHDSKNPVIGKFSRAYSNDPKVVASYAAAFVDGFRDAGIVCSLKHFPGHGFSRGDSHDGFVDISKTWQRQELDPFQMLIRSGHADVIMSAHLRHASLGKGSEPVTFSKKALEGTLRGALRYNGLIITDDLDMGAIRNHYSNREKVVRAIQAGNDILLLSNSAKPDADLAPKVVKWVLEAVGEGSISKRQVLGSAARIQAIKRQVA